MVASILARRRASAYMSHGGRGRHLRLVDEVARESERRPQEFTRTPRAVLRKRRRCFEDQVYFGEQILEGVKRTAVTWHTSIVRPDGVESKRSLFRLQRTFQALPEIC